MNTTMRRQLARLPFEEKIRKVGELIKLSAAVKSSRMCEENESESAMAKLQRAGARRSANTASSR